MVMPGVRTILLVRSLGMVYLVEMSQERLRVWEVQAEQGDRGRVLDCVVILGTEFEDGENEGRSI